MRRQAANRQNLYPVSRVRRRMMNKVNPMSEHTLAALPKFVVALTLIWSGSHVLVAQESSTTQTPAITQPQSQAQSQPQAQTQKSNCDFTLHSVDVNALRRDREKTEADAIALMLRDMDDCLVEQTAHANAGLQNAEAEAQQIYNLNRNFMPGARSNQPRQMGRTSQAGPNSSLSNSSSSNNAGSQMGNQGQGNTGSGTSNAANNIRNQGQSIASKARSQFNRFASSVKDTAKNLGDQVAESTEPQPQSRHRGDSPMDPNQVNNALGSQLGKLEHTFDNYAKTLYEAYETETDPVLKNALLQELNNYVNTPEQ